MALILQTFYNGLTYAFSTTIDAASGSSTTKKTTHEVHNLFEELAKNNYQALLDRLVERSKQKY